MTLHPAVFVSAAEFGCDIQVYVLSFEILPMALVVSAVSGVDDDKQNFRPDIAANKRYGQMSSPVKAYI